MTGDMSGRRNLPLSAPGSERATALSNPMSAVDTAHRTALVSVPSQVLPAPRKPSAAAPPRPPPQPPPTGPAASAPPPSAAAPPIPPPQPPPTGPAASAPPALTTSRREPLPRVREYPVLIPAAEKRAAHQRRRAKPISKWTSDDFTSEISLLVRTAARSAHTRVVWSRVTRQAPQWVHDRKAQRTQEMVAYYFEFGTSMIRLHAIMRARAAMSTRRPAIASGAGAAAPAVATTAGSEQPPPANTPTADARDRAALGMFHISIGQRTYMREVRLMIRGSTGLLARWGQLKNLAPVLDGLAAADHGRLLVQTILKNLTIVGAPRPRHAMILIDGWHPHVYTRVANGRAHRRWRMAVHMSLWLGPVDQEWWRIGVLTVVIGASESGELVALMFLRCKILSVLAQFGLLPLLLIDGGLRRKLITIYCCRFCGLSPAEVQLLSATRDAEIDEDHIRTVASPLPKTLGVTRVLNEWLHLLALWTVPFLQRMSQCPRIKDFCDANIKTSLSYNAGATGGPAAPAAAARPDGERQPAGAAAGAAASRGNTSDDLTSLAIHDITRITRQGRLRRTLRRLLRFPVCIRAFDLICLLRNDIKTPSPETVRERVVGLHLCFKILRIHITMGMHEAAHVPNLMKLHGIPLASFVGHGMELMNQRMNVEIARADGLLPAAMAHINGRIGAVADGTLVATRNPDDENNADVLKEPVVSPPNLTVEEAQAFEEFKNSVGEEDAFTPRYISTHPLDGSFAAPPRANYCALPGPCRSQQCRMHYGRDVCWQCPDGMCGGFGGRSWCASDCS